MRDKRLGWIPDLPDHRDHVFALSARKALPESMDLRAHCPAVYDQGACGSCTANAIAAAIQFERRKQGLKPDFIPSRLFIYYNERVIEGTVESDSGAMIRDGIKSVAKLGDCTEHEWPYHVDRFTVRPTPKCFTDAVKYRALQYQRVPRSLDAMKGCLADGFPFVLGFSVYASFESPEVADTGTAPMPMPGEELLGGHAVLAVGYDDRSERFLLRNSWGSHWGDKGYFTLPYPYLMNADLADDFWTILVVAE